MAEMRDWRGMLADHARMLEERTGAGVAEWNRRVTATGVETEVELRAWLEEQGVSGYPQQLLVMEKFGYPSFLTASADDLVAAQYADRYQLRPILDRIIEVSRTLGDVTVQSRKGFVALQTSRRKFAIVRASTKDRVDLSFRIEGEPGGAGRLEPVNPDTNNDMNLRVGLHAVEDVDTDVVHWLKRAYSANL